MSAGVYDRALNNITITDLRVALVKGYTPASSHATLAAIFASAGCDECDFTNYARKAVGSEAFTVSTGKGMLDAADPAAWSTAGGATNNTISHAIVFEHVGTTDSDNLPVSWHSVGLDTNGGDITLSFSSLGILYTT